MHRGIRGHIGLIGMWCLRFKGSRTENPMEKNVDK